MLARALQLPDTAIQKGDINSELNAIVLMIFLMGMYSIVYIGTMSICLNAKMPASNVVLWTISSRFVCGVIQTGFAWAELHYFFVENGDTRQTIFLAVLGPPRWIHVMNNLFAYVMLALADGLLIWRCFHIWGRQKRVIVLPFILYVAEIALFCTAIVILFVTHARPNPKQALTLDRLESAGFFVSATMSIATTLLIAYRIYKLSRGGLEASMGRFKHIAEILVQSVAVYSLALTIQAISGVLPFKLTNTQLFALRVYSPLSIIIPVTGIAPTVMVARVVLAGNKLEDTYTNTRSINLDFRRPDQSGSANQSDTQVIHGDDDEEKPADQFVGE